MWANCEANAAADMAFNEMNQSTTIANLPANDSGAAIWALSPQSRFEPVPTL